MSMEAWDFMLELDYEILENQMKLTKDETKPYTALVEALNTARQSVSDLELLLNIDDSDEEGGEPPPGRKNRRMVWEAIGSLYGDLEVAWKRIDGITKKYDVTLSTD